MGRILRPTPITGPKLQTWWQGPFLINESNGSQNYTIEISKANLKKVHIEKIKKSIQSETPELLLPLVYESSTPNLKSKKKKIWGDHIIDEVGNSCPRQLLIQWEDLVGLVWCVINSIASCFSISQPKGCRGDPTSKRDGSSPALVGTGRCSLTSENDETPFSRCLFMIELGSNLLWSCSVKRINQ